MLNVGYGVPAEQGAKDLLELASVAQKIILEQRSKIYQEFADVFRGSVEEFCSVFGLSRAVFYRLGLRVKAPGQANG